MALDTTAKTNVGKRVLSQDRKTLVEQQTSHCMYCVVHETVVVPQKWDSHTCFTNYILVPLQLCECAVYYALIQIVAFFPI